LKSSLGQLAITQKQAEKLGVESYGQISPHLENCCLRLSAVVSYAQASLDLAYLTGMQVSPKTQQRLVHRQDFALPEITEPIAELAVDGGTVRLRTPEGEPSEWRHYKAVITDQGVMADFRQNQALIARVNGYPLANPLTCLGDGHDGIWNIIGEIGTAGTRREVLDWYHLKENLYKLSLANKRLKQAESLLWEGKVDDVLTLFERSRQKQVKNLAA
jgi:hypothetical protein